MLSNRSLKEILYHHQKVIEQNTPKRQINVFFPNSPTYQQYTGIEYNRELKKNDSEKQVRFHRKNTQSQANLEVPVLKFHATAQKNYATNNKTDRSQQDNKKYQQVQNHQITCFQKYVPRIYDSKLKIMTPSNKINSVIEEPKKPKILQKQKQLTFFQQFRLGKILGKGRFGHVYRAQHHATKFIVAVKQISLEKVCKKLIERLVWQIKIQSFLKNEHCLELYKFYKEGNFLYLVVELGDCSLFDQLRKKKYFTEAQTCYYITQTIKALIHMHEQGVIHRDLKPQNIVLVNNTVKLADFGWAIYIGKNQKRKTFCGTLDYVSPEIVMGAQYDQMVDVWSVGVLCYELSTGHAPFESTKSRQETFKKIVNVDLKFPKYLSPEIIDFITRLLIKKPENRMTLQEALHHPWVTKNLLKQNP